MLCSLSQKCTWERYKSHLWVKQQGRQGSKETWLAANQGEKLV